MAWKNGRFQFSNSDIRDIMRQVARWYDVDVEFKGTIDEKFSGGISRQVKASQLLKILEATDKVKFIIENQRIVVEPK
jgi:hypothetical protein